MTTRRALLTPMPPGISALGSVLIVAAAMLTLS